MANSGNAEQILEFVKNEPGVSRNDILGMFKESERRSVNGTIGQMLREGWSGKLIEQDGRLYPGPAAHDTPLQEIQTQRNLKLRPEPYSGKTKLNGSSRKDELTQLSLIELVPAYTEVIEIPANAQGRNITVLLQVTIQMGRDVQKVGYALEARKNSVVWIPPGGETLRIFTGDEESVMNSELDKNMEPMPNDYYLVFMTGAGKKGVISFYKPSHGETFVLLWD